MRFPGMATACPKGVDRHHEEWRNGMGRRSQPWLRYQKRPQTCRGKNESGQKRRSDSGNLSEQARNMDFPS